MFFLESVNLPPDSFCDRFFRNPVEEHSENPLFLDVDHAVFERDLLEQLQFAFIYRSVVGEGDEIGVGGEAASRGAFGNFFTHVPSCLKQGFGIGNALSVTDSSLDESHFLQFSLHRAAGDTEKPGRFGAVVPGAFQCESDHLLFDSSQVEVFVG